MQHEHSLRYLRPQSVRHLVCGGTVQCRRQACKDPPAVGDESADIVYNLALFNMTGQGSDRYGVIKGRTLQYLKAKGRECGYGGTPERLVLDSSNAVSGWKLAVKDGKVSSTLGKSDRRSRNMCGLLTDGRYIHVQTSASHTEYEVAQYVRDRYDVKLQHGDVSRVGRLPVRAGKRGSRRQTGVQCGLH